MTYYSEVFVCSVIERSIPTHCLLFRVLYILFSDLHNEGFKKKIILNLIYMQYALSFESFKVNGSSDFTPIIPNRATSNQ